METETSWNVPLSTVKREDVSCAFDAIKNSIDVKETVPLLGLIVKTGVFVPIDWTIFLFFVSASPLATLNPDSIVLPTVSAG